MIQFKCVKCGETMEASDSAAGSGMSCAKCGNVNVVPSPAPAQASVASIAAPLTPEEQNARQWGMLCHLLGVVGLWNVGVLLIFLLKSKEHPFIEANAKAAFNFQLSFALYAFGSAVLSPALIGIPLLAAAIITAIVCTIMATLRARNGETFHYPLVITFVK